MNMKYKLCILDSAFKESNNNEYNKFFGLLLSLRMKGYMHTHGINAIPIDSYDYIATNILLYREQNNEIEPLACSRIVRYSMCRGNNLEFVPLSLLDDEENVESIEAIRNFILNETNDITFDSSFTIAPKYKCTKESQIIIQYILGAVFCWHRDNGLNNFFASATLKIKTDKLFNKLGLESISNDAQYKLKSINNEPALMMKFISNYTQVTEQFMKKTEELWRRRYVY